MNLEHAQRKEEDRSDFRWDTIKRKGVWVRVEKLIAGD